MTDAYDRDTQDRRVPLSDTFAALLDRLQTDADERVGRRRLVEERWLRDMRQYEGRDDDDIIAELRNAGRSTAVVNITRPKCNTFESKLFDMLFPTDDRNWGISPTPVPEMDLEISRQNGEVDRLVRAGNAEPDEEAAAELEAEANALAERIKELEDERAEARARADLMAEEIADNLVETDYPQHCRMAIHDATILGTGFIKGPLPLSERVRKNWSQNTDGGAYRLQRDPESEGRMSYQHVSAWNVYPDLGARSFRQVESWMERHLMRPRDLREFAKHPGVDKDAVRRLLEEGPGESVPQHLVDLDTVVEEEQSTLNLDYFVVWEFRGPLNNDEMQELMMAVHQRTQADRDEGDDEEMEPVPEVDPLTQTDAVVWFCQGEILKLGINHMDDNSEVYAAFQIEKSDARLWSVGIPYLMRTQAAVLNDAWRAMLDNAEFSAFPIVEINRAIIQRADGGRNVLAPRSVWDRVGGAAANPNPGLILHPIPIHQEQYAAIIELVMRFTDQETNISILAQGEQGATSRTAGGMALLMNSVNVVFRRVVKEFDDGITTPVITRGYHFQMQFNPREELKGDYAVQARGSSVLLVREIQAQNLLMLAMQASQHPVLGRLLKMRELMKRLVQSMMIPTDDVLKTTSELEEDAAAEAEAAENAPPDPAMVKLQLDQQIAQMTAETDLAVAQIRAETDAGKAQVMAQTALETMQARLAGIKAQVDSGERKLSAEIAVDAAKPPGAPGSGGRV